MRALQVAIVAGVLATGSIAQTVTLDLTSAQNGQDVTGGATIDWQIAVTVSGGDNAGLAGVITDLVQAAGNPEALDIPPAASVPPAMSNFSRPDGISNPGESNPTTGYTGLQRGVSGSFDLVQIGGAQNSFGVAQPGGTGIAENATVVGAVGQSGSVVIASGSFTAPTTEGTYAFSLGNPQANVFTSIATPPAISPAVAASVATGTGAFSFTVVAGSGCGVECDVPGGDADVNDDCNVDLSDLAVVLANFGLSGVATETDGDTNGDSNVDLTDLANILAVFGTACP